VRGPADSGWRGRAAWAALLLCLCGCELAQETQARVVARHRAQARGGVGALRGMEVHQRAARLSRALQARTDAECEGLPARGPAQVALTLEVKVIAVKTGAPVATLREERLLRRDARDHVEATWRAEFLDPSGRVGRWERRELLLPTHHYVAEQNLPFVRRAASLSSRKPFEDRALDIIPTLLEVPGSSWFPSGDGRYEATAGAQGQALRCGVGALERAWLSRLLEVASLERAEVTLSPTRRAVTMRLTSAGAPGELSIQVQAEELAQAPDGAPVEAPARVEEPRRDRPYKDIEAILTERLGLTEWQR
jgi:hypothetical protein